MSRILVITYSFTGTGSRLTESLCRSRGWTSARVRERRPRRHGITPRCAIESFLRLKPAVIYDGPDPADFDLTVLVAPIWLSRLASPMRSFVANFRGALRHVAVISVMGGKGEQDAAQEIGAILNKPPVMSTSFTRGEVNDGSYAPRLLALAAALEATADLRHEVAPFMLAAEAAA